MITNLTPYPAYKDSGVEWLGLVPEHWRVTRLRHVVTCLDGKRVPLAASDRGKMLGPIPYWGANKIIDYLNDYLFDEDLILLGEDGAPFFDRNRPVAFFSQGKVWPNNHIHVLRPKGMRQPEFLVHALNSVDYARYVGGATRDKLTQSQMNAIRIPVPVGSEQTAIVRFLDHVERRIRRYIRTKERLLELLEEQKQAVTHQAVTGQIDVRTGQPYPAYNASGVDGFAHVPAHWEVRRIKTMFRLRTEKSGVAHGRELLSIYTHIGVRPRKELEEKGNKASTTDDYWIVKKGDLILNKLLAWMGAVGVSHYDGVTSPAYDILMPIVDLASDYYHHLFRTRIYLAQFKKRSRGIMDMRLRLYFDQCGQIPVPVPTGGEQQAIVEFLNEIILETDHIINRTRRQIEMLREYRARLIADVVTGKLDVREAAVAMSEELDAPTDTIKLENTTEMQEDVAG